MVRRIRALLALSVVASGLLLAAPGAVLADCIAPPPVAEAIEKGEIVFVGTVDATTEGNRWARVTIEEVWRGPDHGPTVVVKGGPAGNMATSVDRHYEAGVKYIFFPHVDPEQGGLADNSCSNTQPWTDDLAALRPADARTPVDPTAAPEGFQLDDLMPFALVAVVFAALLGIGLVARGRADA